MRSFDSRAALRAAPRLLLFAISAVCVGWGAAWTATAGTDVWLAPLDPLTRPFNGTHGSADYFDLFRNDARWPATAARVKVFKIYPQLILEASDDAISHVLTGLRNRHIALALEFGVLTDTTCGRGVEGYDGEELVKVAQRIKRLGGTLEYLAMDEPLWYGRHYSGASACRAGISSIAHDVAGNLANLKSVMPRIEVGDIEPVPQVQISEWSAELLEWADAFSNATGARLAFLHADVIWNQPWELFLVEIRKKLHARGIPLGVILNGNEGDSADDEWIAHAEQHCRLAGTRAVDQLIFQSWTNNPTRVLPESQPWTMTALVLNCLRTKGSVKRRP